ncbi:unnamed protein product [Rhizoctonia solani]|uniref:Protein kinase domain-containing protein n=1 Tax=Rhizoctonia solani TaxID=456999 RepID=A0A8H3B957_9AGAM|nr:unnamed protein product [Rhizoctonia solani]CAE6495761.1 unnamed protein product [Rhizoctonia solani]
MLSQEQFSRERQGALIAATREGTLSIFRSPSHQQRGQAEDSMHPSPTGVHGKQYSRPGILKRLVNRVLLTTSSDKSPRTLTVEFVKTPHVRGRIGTRRQPAGVNSERERERTRFRNFSLSGLSQGSVSTAYFPGTGTGRFYGSTRMNLPTRVPSHQSGYGGCPMPHELAGRAIKRFFPKALTMTHTMGSMRGKPRQVSYITFDTSQFHDSFQGGQEELRGVEYRASGALESTARPSSTYVAENMKVLRASEVLSRNMAVREVISHLVAHGCQDLSGELDLSSFGEYPVSHGGLSDIYKGLRLDGGQVAVKVLRVSADNISQGSKHLKHAARELHTWSRCGHPNIMPLLGLAVFRGRIGMVAHWMKHGNLPEYLKVMPGVNRYSMCVQICEGLSYLHRIRIVHCDLKGANVLVSDEGVPLLTDFGTSLVSDRTLQFTATTSGLSCTLRWSAAELLRQTSPHTEASDVYSLGMTIYETISGEIPYHGKNEYNVICLVTLEKELPERPNCMPVGDEKADMLWKLLTQCWSYEPEARPSASEVATAMKEFV